jgi:hypothetical protein
MGQGFRNFKTGQVVVIDRLVSFRSFATFKHVYLQVRVICRPSLSSWYGMFLFPHHAPADGPKSALFNFQSLLLVILLMICTCTYVRGVAPRLVDRNKAGYVAFID